MADTNRGRNYFHAAEEAVRKGVLAPAGFDKGKHLYLREAAGQIHAIGFQANRFGGSYFVNLGFHYSFLPAFLAGRRIDSREFHELDCLFRTRLEKVIEPPHREGEWKYGETFEETESVLARNSRIAIAALDAHAARWSKPELFLEMVPPGRILEHLREFEAFQRRCKSDPALSYDEERRPVDEVLGDDWTFGLFPLTFFLASIALRSGQPAMAEAYLETAERLAESRQDLAVLRELAPHVRAARRSDAR